MGDISVAVIVQAPLARVWAAVEDLGSHVDWMADARRIDFLSESRSGVGTRFECLTVLGPLRLRDVLEVTRWEPPYVVAVRHDGLVTGSGSFVLTPLGEDRTHLRWAETLSFPLGVLGQAAALAGDRILARVWSGNLRRLAAIVVGPTSG